MESLNHGEKEIFEKFTDAQAEIDGITHYEKFTYGFRLGVLLTTEAFTGAEGLVRNFE